jgi:hypothetical protein
VAHDVFISFCVVSDIRVEDFLETCASSSRIDDENSSAIRFFTTKTACASDLDGPHQRIEEGSVKSY